MPPAPPPVPPVPPGPPLEAWHQDSYHADPYVDPNASILQRLAALERGRADQERLWRHLSQRCDRLQIQTDSLQEQHQALASCLQAAGYVRLADMRRQLRVHRCAHMIQEVLQRPELSMLMGAYGGIVASRAIWVTSREIFQGMRAVIPELDSLLMPKVYVCGGRRDGNCLPTVERFGIDSGTWETMPPMPTPRYGCTATAHGGCLYVFGGHGGGPLLNTAELYDPDLNSWQTLPPMPTARSGCTVASLHGQIYVIGGFDGRQPLSVAERYDPRVPSGATPSSTLSILPPWEQLPDMPTARYCCTSVVVDSYLYVVGGHGGRRALATAERFDPKEDIWLAYPKMPTARHSCASLATAGFIYVLGGFDGRQALSQVERLDNSCTRWTQLAPMPTAIYEFAAASVTGVLYIFGGHNGWQALDSSWRFSPATGRWEQLLSMPAARGGCTCAAVGG
eukprot:TRINITY_DN102655_c0_g1_i1.p1 TRINITY_DN102655_c0_g1~~TRINITY_DN102655_c0_g1_i1.p1  ORF type:complete len:452 (+),score=46.98 TRINITY_DN102655_c0_g1_i1:93-1448(+)